MSICYDTYGDIKLNQKNQEFADKLQEIILSYDKHDSKFRYSEEKELIQYRGYGRHYIIDSICKLLEEYKDFIKIGKVVFYCTDEDGSLERPFPIKVIFEIRDGKTYGQEVNTILPAYWEYYEADDQWWAQLRKEDKKKQKKEEIQHRLHHIKYKFTNFFKRFKKKKNDNDDGLPF